MNIILAILVLSVIVIAHEFGHFILAKANGVMVMEFSIGFGPRLLHFKKGETIYSIKLLPFGGACMMLGEDMDMGGEDDHVPDSDEDADAAGQGGDRLAQEYDMSRSFGAKSVWARMSILAAGPIFNFILAFLLAVVIIGSVGYDPCEVSYVAEDSPAAEAGLQEGDLITRINGRKAVFSKELTLVTTLHPDRELNVVYTRDGNEYTTTIVPEYRKRTSYMTGITLLSDCTISSVENKSPAKSGGLKINDVIVSINGVAMEDSQMVVDTIQGSDGSKLKLVVSRDGQELTLFVTPTLTERESYYIGMTSYGYRVSCSALKTLEYSFSEVGYWIRAVIGSLGMIFRGQVTLDDVSGPVGVVSTIGNVVEQSKSDGWFYVFLNLFNMAVMISANLGVMNLLPLPALDGGRLLFVIIEILRGKPVSREKEGMVHFVGMILLMILMVVVLVNDVANLF